MKKIFILRSLFSISLVSLIIITAFKDIKPIVFYDLISVFGAEILMISFSTILIIRTKFKTYSISFKLNQLNSYFKVFIQTFHVFRHIEIILVYLLFFLYVFKAFDFNDYLDFIIFLIGVLLNNYLVILFHLFVFHFSNSNNSRKALNNTFTILTFIMVMTNLPVINDMNSFKEFLYYFPLPGAFLLPINPNTNISVLIVVPISMVLLPFVLLYNHKKNDLGIE